ncbi:hypothetical protein LCGC14_0964980 [marine sediment metagenome]|uniref:Uncharacterized protein n=1 Tax=marine sediment metagenome TaxID=412755 RepID=A0A0F9RJU7_9ZZZZ
MTSQLEYKFAFNNDIASCQALRVMVMAGWTFYAITVEDGYTWFILHYEHEGENNDNRTILEGTK